MSETIGETNETHGAIKTEATLSDLTTLKSPQEATESKLSPYQDEQDLIDITTVKAEDCIDSKTCDRIDIKTEADDIKKVSGWTDNKAEDGGSMDLSVKGETINSSTIDSDNTQSSLPMEINNVGLTGMVQEQMNATQSILVDNQQAMCSSSTTNFEEIQNQLKKTLDHIEQRQMVSGFRTLSNATNAVVEHCEQLGLTSDDHPYNAIDREQFWAGLNNCWLYALAQRHEPSSTEEKMTDQQFCSLRERVVTWADKLERYGLVDYEMGWWEADILAALDAILATNYASAQAVAQATVAKATVALFGEETSG